MATSTKKSWKLQDFTAHSSNVNCLALGHKSGRVLVTGGDDKKVNLWAVGKQNCIMSLSGHTTPIECVRFGQTEDLVCAGSQTGALKIWDLEQAKLARTLTGHKAGIKCMDFHPYGELLTSGSLDTGIKLWDIRRKGCIFTYKGHNETVNSLKFSPDGQWIASAGEEGMVKLWDLRAGRQLREFSEHRRAATTVEFHPHEFLLASGSMDRTVHFWDLESFQLVSSTDANLSAIRCLHFSQGGECLFAGSQDLLKVFCWEPARTLDTVPTGWGKIQDIAIAQSQLIGASANGSNVVVFVCDLKKIAPFANISQLSSPFAHGNPSRRSFTRENPRKHSVNVKTTIEEGDKSGSDPEDEESNVEIQNLTTCEDIFQPHRSLSRTPPPEPEAFPEPQEIDPTQPQIIQNFTTSLTNLSTGGSQDVEEDLSPSSSIPPPSLFTKPVSVRNNPIKSSPPVQRHLINSSIQVKLNVQTVNNTSAGKNVKNFAQIPPLRQSITPLVGKKTLTNNSSITQPLGPQRSNSTLTSRVAPMAAVSPSVMGGDGKSKSRAPSPDSPKHFFKRQSSCKDGEHGYESDFPVQINTNIKHSPSDPALNRPNTGQTRSNSMARNFINSGPLSARNLAPAKKNNRAQIAPNPKVDIRVPQLKQEAVEKDDFVPMIPDKPIGLDVDDFLPSTFSGLARLGCNQVLSETSEVEIMNSLMRGQHDSMMAVLTNRQRSLQIIYSLWHNKDVKSAIDSAVAMNDLSVIVDLLGVLNLKATIWNLDICNSLLRPIAELLQSKYEMYVTVGCTALKLILRNFAPVIKSNVEAPLHSIGVDVSREERYHKCLSCYEKLEAIRPLILRKQSSSGQIGSTFREINVLMNTLV